MKKYSEREQKQVEGLGTRILGAWRGDLILFLALYPFHILINNLSVHYHHEIINY